MACDRTMDNAPGMQFNDEEDKEWAKPDVIGLEKITSPYSMSVILQKAAPRLTGLSRRRRRANLADVFGDGAFREAIAQLLQFIPNAFDSPQVIVACHAVDESNHVFRDTWLWCS